MKKKPETASSSATFVRNSQPNSAVKKELVSTKLASRTSPPKPKSKTNPPTKSPEKGLAEGKPLTIVGVGASAGGLEAFTQLLRNLPSNTGMAFVLVQHLDPKHESMLTQLLSQRTKMPVSEAKDGMAVEPDHVYIIPPNRDMTISSRVLGLALRTEVRGHHMPIDQFFHSLAEDQKSRAIAVILSGTASDGAQGLRAIKAQGGITFAQDEKSAKYGGMPHSAVEAGAVDLILPPEGIARELVRISRHPYAQAYPLAELPAKAGMLPGGIRTGDTFEKNGDDLAKIFSLLQSSAGVDFTYYKRATVKRRILRRMALLRLEDRKDYVKYLRDNPSEVEALYHDVLINVTGFFRDPETFEALGEKVFPEITRNRGPQAPIRIWVPGCSTGEEAYSVAISLVEFLGKKAAKIPVQIFATDLSDRAINNARTGRYPESIARDFSPERLERFFVKADGSYQVSKSIREVCVFAKHDVTRDPPFSNLDLISCRNVMIYMGPVLQKRAMAFFHYALKPTGFLLLGKSEAIGRFPDLFAVADRKYKIYSKKPVPNPTSLDLAPMDYGSKKVDIGRGTGEAGFDIKKEVERIILSRYTPAGVVVNDRLEILDFHGHTGLYLEHSPGGASLNLLKMAREGIKLPLRTAIHEAKKQGGSVRTEGLQVNFNGHLKELTLEVIPVKAPHPGEGYFLILFEDAAPSPLGDAGARIPVGGKVRWRQTGRGEQKAEIVRLEQEIQATKKHLQSIIEEYEATNEELKAANEEVLSGNEELQSINEELETAKEELQSTNEELTTLNDELQSRNLTLDQLNFDMINLLTSVNLPVIMLGSDLRIRRFTPLAEKVLNLSATDIGRSILHLRLGIHVPDLETSILEVINTGIVKEGEVQDPEGVWYSMQIRPYRTTENRIDGAVLTWINIDALKQSLEQIKESRDYAEAIVETVREPLIILDKNLHVKTANHSFYQTFQTSPGETEGRLIYELGNHQWDIPDLRRLLDDILPRDTSFEDFEIEHEFPAIGVKTMRLNARRIAQNRDGMQMILLAIEDVTERRRAESLAQVRLRIANTVSLSVDEILQKALDEIESLTGSRIGFYHFLEADQETLSLQSWSTNTVRNMCTAEGKGSHYPISKAGVWVDCVHERRPVIHNDFASLPHRKGMPPGHTPVIREMVVPIFRGGQVVAIIGVGNKPTNYDATDVEIASLLGDFSWEIVERKWAEQTIENSEKRYRSYIEVTKQLGWITNADGEVVEDIPVWRKFTGQSEEETKGAGWAKALHPDDVKRTMEAWNKAVATKSAYEVEYRIRRYDEAYRHFLARGVPVFKDDGNIQEWVGTCIDITERKQIEDAQKFLLQCGLPASGEDFFKSLARYLAENLGMDYVCIDRLQGEGLAARTVAIYFDGKFEDNLTYALKDTPCGDVVDKTVCCFPKGVRHLYPQDVVLREMMAESYVGAILSSSKGQPIGLIAIIGRQPLANPQLAESMLKLVAVRAAGELERKEAEEALRQRSLELQQLTETLEQRVQERTAELATANLALRHLSTKLLSAQEGERKRIAGELHDTIGSYLGGIKFKVQDAVEQIEKTPKAATESLNTIVPVIQEAIEECRRIQMDLRPSMLDDLGLLPTLSWFFRRFETIYSGIRIEQEIGIEELEIPGHLRTVIYRVIQEAMNNITKHSQADFVYLSLRKLDDKLELTMQDNGRGFDLEKAYSQESRSRGLGLSSMRERVELSFGSFAIESSEGKGTIIRAFWPIKQRSP